MSDSQHDFKINKRTTLRSETSRFINEINKLTESSPFEDMLHYRDCLHETFSTLSSLDLEIQYRLSDSEYATDVEISNVFEDLAKRALFDVDSLITKRREERRKRRALSIELIDIKIREEYEATRSLTIANPFQIRSIAYYGTTFYRSPPREPQVPLPATPVTQLIRETRKEVDEFEKDMDCKVLTKSIGVKSEVLEENCLKKKDTIHVDQDEEEEDRKLDDTMEQERRKALQKAVVRTTLEKILEKAEIVTHAVADVVVEDTIEEVIDTIDIEQSLMSSGSEDGHVQKSRKHTLQCIKTVMTKPSKIQDPNQPHIARDEDEELLPITEVKLFPREEYIKSDASFISERAMLQKMNVILQKKLYDYCKKRKLEVYFEEIANLDPKLDTKYTRQLNLFHDFLQLSDAEVTFKIDVDSLGTGLISANDGTSITYKALVDLLKVQRKAILILHEIRLKYIRLRSSLSAKDARFKTRASWWGGRWKRLYTKRYLRKNLGRRWNYHKVRKRRGDGRGQGRPPVILRLPDTDTRSVQLVDPLEIDQGGEDVTDRNRK